jgi:hypothetical protein
MDPNAALRLAREALAEAQSCADEANRIVLGAEHLWEEFENHKANALVHYEALDAWLSKGCALPDAWNDYED